METAKNKTALVTGASSGIGLEICRELASRGCKPVLVARREERLNELAKVLKNDFGIEAPVIAMDLLEANATEKLYKKTSDAGLEIDILVNNAGFGFKGPLHKSSLENYRNMVNLNINVLTELTYLYSKNMLEKQSGGIINVASMAGFGPIPYFSVYAASKSYVIQFSQALWQEFSKSGIHVSALCPGPVETEFFEVASLDPAKMSMRSIQKPDEVAKIAIESLLKNKRVVPTSASLKLMAASTKLAPTVLTLKAAEVMMGKEM